MQRRLGHRVSAWQRRLIGLALSALLVAQWLALVHGVGHRGVGTAPWDGLQAPAATLAQGLLKAVTGHDEKSPVCQLFDQLAQSSPLEAAPPMPAANLPTQVPPTASELPAWSAPQRHYQARAPPVLA